MNKFSAYIICFVLLFVSFDAMARAAVASPDGQILFTAIVDDNEKLFYQVSFGDETVIADSRLGLRFRQQSGFDSGFDILEVVLASHDETWEQPWGERRLVRDSYNQLIIRLEDLSGRRFDLRVRVFNDGVGFRYEVPEQPGFETVHIVDELTEFHLPERSTAWWIPGHRYNRYEYYYRKTGLNVIESAHTPMTVRTPAGTHLSIHEAALLDYSAFTLQQQRDNVFKTNLRPWSDGVRVKTAAPFKTPWRTIQIGKDAVGLLNSSLILNLNEPNLLGDVESGGRCTSASGPGNLGRSMARQHKRRSVTWISRPNMVSMAFWWKAGISAGMVTGSPMAICSASLSRTRISTFGKFHGMGRNWESD
jgi:alpha-glucosidase